MKDKQPKEKTVTICQLAEEVSAETSPGIERQSQRGSEELIEKHEGRERL